MAHLAGPDDLALDVAAPSAGPSDGSAQARGLHLTADCRIGRADAHGRLEGLRTCRPSAPRLTICVDLLGSQGVVTDEEAGLYREYIREVAHLCKSDPAFRRTRVVRLARRQGSAYAIREAVQGHVSTPLVLVTPHDCVVARPVRLDAGHHRPTGTPP